MGSVFIHYSPAIVTWSLYWFRPDFKEAFPKAMFDENVPIKDFLDLYLPALLTYLGWTFFYLVWVIIHGRFQRKQKNGYDTMFQYMVRKTPGFAKTVGYNRKQPDNLKPFFNLLMWSFSFYFHDDGFFLCNAFGFLYTYCSSDFSFPGYCLQWVYQILQPDDNLVRKAS